jgi:hypothetical protein
MTSITDGLVGIRGIGARGFAGTVTGSGGGGVGGGGVGIGVVSGGAPGGAVGMFAARCFFNRLSLHKKIDK